MTNLQGGQLISINEAAAAGIERLRQPHWVAPEDHVKIDIVDGRPGPWLHFFSALNAAVNERDPVDLLLIHAEPDKPCFLPYTGPLPGSEAYREAASMFRRAQG